MAHIKFIQHSPLHTRTAPLPITHIVKGQLTVNILIFGKHKKEDLSGFLVICDLGHFVHSDVSSAKIILDKSQ